MVSCAAFRRPSLLASEAVTIDHVSNGRVEVGLGAGWWAEEHRRWGFSFPEPAKRVARFRETVEGVDRLLRTWPACPAPVQRPRPPLALAAQGRRMLEVVAEFADTWVASFGLSPAEIAARIDLLGEAASAHGRSTGAIRRAFVWAPWVDDFDPWSSVAAFEDFAGRYGEAGVTDFIFDEPEPSQRPVLERVAGEVLPRRRRGGDTVSHPSSGSG